jgi:hypothetical protein
VPGDICFTYCLSQLRLLTGGVRPIGRR